MAGFRKRDYSLVVMDSSNEKVFNEVLGIVGCSLYKNGGKFSYRDLDMNHPTMKVINVKTTANYFQFIKELLDKFYPGLCVYNVA